MNTKEHRVELLYGLLLAACIGLGLFAGWLTRADPTPVKVPENLGRDVDRLLHGNDLLIKRQMHLLNRLVPKEEWDLP